MKNRLPSVFALVLVGLLVLGVFSHVRRTNGFGESFTGLPVDRLMSLPVYDAGRLKPLDTVARAYLMVIAQRQYYHDENGRKVTSADWLAELLLDPVSATQRRVFRIDHPDVVGLLGFQNEKRKFFSLSEIIPHQTVLEQQMGLVAEEPRERDAYQRELVKLRHAIGLFNRKGSALVIPGLFGPPLHDLHLRSQILADLATLEPESERAGTALNGWRFFQQHYQNSDRSAILAVYPENPDEEWRTVAASLQEPVAADPMVHAYAALAEAYRARDAAAFDRALSTLESLKAARVTPAVADDLGLERFFHAWSPFILSIGLYVIVSLCVFFAWLFLPRTLLPAAFGLLILTFLVHSFGLVARMDIQDRPPVTNLHSSAIFVGWFAVLLCVLLEGFLRNGVACLAAAVIGVVTLIIAHHLSFSGDTMEVMRAVLDSNFWLATHVLVITAGYSATFLAGFLGIVFLILDRVIGGQTNRNLASIERMVYGVVCFALLSSFVGTILGGIWADQSWGRFWGWDPKENGALMIVLWNAVILHARWSKLASHAGLMQMAIIGNVITAWSWFGTNLLGVGLHSYGFTDSGFFWLMIFLATQVAFILLGLLPPRPRAEASEEAATALPPALPVPDPGAAR
jgi:ABC-type transport system involved in cytochrome c biogenesis permease subunit